MNDFQPVVFLRKKRTGSPFYKFAATLNLSPGKALGLNDYRAAIVEFAREFVFYQVQSLKHGQGVIVKRAASLTIATAAITILFSITTACTRADDEKQEERFAAENRVAWCIVPFDAKKRGPAERAEMLVRLGITNIAYDWREEHVATFEDEIVQYRQHKLNYLAFWSWHDAMEPLIRKYDIHPQIWVMMKNSPEITQEAKVADAAAALLPLVEKTRSLNCKLAIYNHGGWAGEPSNMVEVVRRLREQHDAAHVGIVYNFHHGHEHIADFQTHMESMEPYLFCLNINGMEDASVVASGKNKILPVGAGKHEVAMLKIVKASKYNGPIGILDHRPETDSELTLKENMEGLDTLIKAGI
jgi:hypothetical protein